MSGVDEIAERILVVESEHPIRVAVDGFCAAGKTTLGDALGLELQGRGRGVIRASGDAFQNPPEVRHQLGDRSAEGFFRHAMNLRALREQLLDPLGPNGSLAYRTSVYDVFASRVNLSPQLQADRREILVLDGLFLHSPVLTGCFEFTIFVEASYETCIARARTRRQERFHEPDAIESLYRERYMPGFELYLREVQPQTRASIIVTTD